MQSLYMHLAIAGDVWVNGYTRSDGTNVRGHYRSSPDAYKWNNYGPSRSTPELTNPYLRDNDRDGTPNLYDHDDDNDGIYDDFDKSQYQQSNIKNNNYYLRSTPEPTNSYHRANYHDVAPNLYDYDDGNNRIYDNFDKRQYQESGINYNDYKERIDKIINDSDYKERVDKIINDSDYKERVDKIINDSDYKKRVDKIIKDSKERADKIINDNDYKERLDEIINSGYYKDLADKINDGDYYKNLLDK